MFGNDRNKIRQYYIDTWQKAKQGQALEELESVIAETIKLHPEYHSILEAGEDSLDKDYTPESGESNPFLHMGMHIAIHEQLSTNRPTGIREIYQKIIKRNYGDVHKAEHKIMECLAEMIWQAQRDGVAPDEKRYLKNLKKLAKT